MTAVPTALWQVDARAAGEVFDRLKSEGVTDIAAFLDAHPELVELAQDVVRVTEVNREAVALFAGRNAADLLRPIRYLFAATPDMGKRVMVAHFDGRRNYVEQAKVFTFDGQTRDVMLSVTFPAPPEQLDTTFVTMVDVTDQLLPSNSCSGWKLRSRLMPPASRCLVSWRPRSLTRSATACCNRHKRGDQFAMAVTR